MKISIISALFLSSCSALTVSSRRALFQQASAAALGGLAFASQANALDACPPKSQNCIRTSWTAPEGASKSDMVDTILSVLNAYPQEGQNGADNSGYTIVDDKLANNGYARVEYRNFGNFAKFLNGGKPFVDDLIIEIDGSNQVQVNSASRVGESDFGVNQKRLLYLGNALKSKGWTVPDPTY